MVPGGVLPADDDDAVMHPDHVDVRAVQSAEPLAGHHLVGSAGRPAVGSDIEDAVVKDEIQLVFDVDPADVNRLVRGALDSHRVPPDNSHVVARASGNTVMLGGGVRTRTQRDAVVAAAWRGHAVMAVIDELEITG
jgi:osmotically-inducible protein OsmY